MQVTGRTLVLSQITCWAAVNKQWLRLMCHSTYSMTVVDLRRLSSEEEHQTWLTEDINDKFNMALPYSRFGFIQFRVVQFRPQE